MTGPRVKARGQQDAEQQVVAAVVAKADALLVDARRQFTVALMAHVRSRPNAALETRAAIDLIEQVRAQIAGIADEGKR